MSQLVPLWFIKRELKAIYAAVVLYSVNSSVSHLKKLRGLELMLDKTSSLPFYFFALVFLS
jgi:hypothetical protein